MGPDTMRWVVWAVLLGGCGRSCAGSDATRVVLRQEGAGWRVEATCTVTTRVVLDRSQGPLLRGCQASGTVRWTAGAATRTSSLAGCDTVHEDCAVVRRYCDDLRVEWAERVTASGRVLAVAASGARDASLVALTPGGAWVRYPVDRSHGGVRGALAAAPEPDALALQLARAGRLSSRDGGQWADELAPVFTDAFVARHRDELMAAALRCELQAGLVERVLAVGGDAAFEALEARADGAPGQRPCEDLRAALRHLRPARLQRGNVGAEPPP